MIMRTICCFLVITLLAPAVRADSWTEHVTLKGRPDQPVIISPLAELNLSENTEKVVVVPEELTIKDEIQEFRMFRNRYVIFGVYLSLALYYNWLTRNR